MAEEKLFDMNSLDLSESAKFVKVAKTGNISTEYPFSRIKFVPNKKIRFALLSSEVVMVKRHYMEELGYFLCTGGKCCEVAKKQGATCYIYPAVLYTQCDDRGKISGTDIEVKVLIANKDMYNSLVAINEIKGDLEQYDFLGIQDNSSGKFPKTTIVEAGVISWRTDENIAKVKDYVAKYKDKFLDSVAKKITDEKLDEILKNQKEEAQTDLPQTIQASTEEDISKILKI